MEYQGIEIAFQNPIEAIKRTDGLIPVVNMMMLMPPVLPCFRSIPSARVAILEHRVWANGRRVNHTETALPPGPYTIRVQFGADVYESNLVV